MEAFPCFDGDLVALADDLVDAAVPDHQAHRGLGHVFEQLAHVGDFEKEVVGVFDAILHDPRDDRHVQIAGQHERHVARFRAGLYPGPEIHLRGGGPELLGLNAFDIDLRDRVDAQGQFEVQPRLGGLDIAAEALHDADLVLVDRVERGEGEQQRRDDAKRQRPARKLEVFQSLDDVVHLRRHAAPGALLLF